MRKFYTKFFKECENSYKFWRRIINRSEEQIKIYKRTIQKIQKFKIKILDLGCGDGKEINRALEWFNGIEFSLIGSDTSADALTDYKEINKKFLKKIVLEDLSKIFLPNDKFDLIILSNCLYDIKTKGFFRKIFKMLRKKGKVLIFIESKNSPLFGIRSRFWPKIHNNNYKENTEKEIIGELSRMSALFFVSKIKYNINLEKADQIKKDGIKTLLIPFLFRCNNISDSGQIEKHIRELDKNRKFFGLSSVIVVKKPKL